MKGLGRGRWVSGAFESGRVGRGWGFGSFWCWSERLLGCLLYTAVSEQQDAGLVMSLATERLLCAQDVLTTILVAMICMNAMRSCTSNIARNAICCLHSLRRNLCSKEATSIGSLPETLTLTLDAGAVYYMKDTALVTTHVSVDSTPCRIPCCVAGPPPPSGFCVYR